MATTNTNQIDLQPQVFSENAVTFLPAIDFFEYAKKQIPQVYQNAPNFMAVVKSISDQKQYLYDVIRSMVNIMNLYNTGNGDDTSPPEGVYLKMLASIFNTPFNRGWDEAAINQLLPLYIKLSVLFVNSRGKISDFYKYFLLYNMAESFTKVNCEETGNASLFFNVPVANDPTLSPNPSVVFLNAMDKIKAAGISVTVLSGNTPFFQLGSLPTDPGPRVAEGNFGFGILTPEGVVLDGGFFSSHIPT